MAYYKSIIAYDGTGFHGFQRQADQIRTVQGELESALHRLGWGEASIKAAGRTDAGVHAKGQVVSFHLDWQRTPDLLTNALNSFLAQDLAVRKTLEASEDFHPRRSAIARFYTYQLLLDKTPNPILEYFSWRIWPEPDLGLMRRAAEDLVGIRNFGAFGSAPIEGGHTIRQVRKAEVSQSREFLVLAIEANAFLYHMVRRITAALVDLGSGRIDYQEWQTLLEAPENRWQGRIAPARGLFLERVLYKEDEVRTE
jgi:tRNA pseudouridine38-40 synthase